jgi:DNA-binding response OmpR family regulator/tetratricopeptide (TPR) repeat protein
MAGYVLVVESDAELQRQIGATLRDAGFDLHAEAEAAWARRSVGTRVPDVIVVDTRLADGDGFSFAEELRHAPETRATPIVFVASTHRGVSHRAEARRRFAPADYLPTPLDLGQLVPRVAELAARAAGVTPPPVPVESLSEEDLEIDDGSDQVTPPPVPPVPPVPKEALRDPAQQRERRDVERSAKSLAADPGDAELQGTLKRTPFARLLQRLYAKRATGSLLLLHEATKKIVIFVEGYPVSVRSNVLGETLGRILLEKKLITSEVLAESVGRMQKEKRHQGEILVEMGALSPFNLDLALIEQVEAKLFEVFSWSDGKFMFKAGAAAAGELRLLERSPAATILEGIRRHYDEARQNAALEKYAHQYVGLTSDPLMRLQDMTSDPVELTFIQSIDGSKQLETILERAEIPRDKARLLLVALSEAGMLQRHETTTRKKGAALPVVPPVSSLPVTGALGAPAAPPPNTAPLASGQLSMMLQTVRTQDYFWALDVGREAPAAEIDRAYEALARSFHADRYRLSPEDDRKAAQEIFDRLTEAHRTLRDPAKRKAYLTKLARANDEAEQAPQPERPRMLTPAPPTSGAAGSSPSNAAARALYEVGLEHLKARRHHEAVEALRQAARLVPNEADFRAALGWALFRQAPADARAGRAAVAELRRALQLDERHRAACQHLAEIYAQTGQPDLAVQELERLLAIDPAATEVAEELHRLRTK